MSAINTVYTIFTMGGTLQLSGLSTTKIPESYSSAAIFELDTWGCRSAKERYMYEETDMQLRVAKNFQLLKQ